MQALRDARPRAIVATLVVLVGLAAAIRDSDESARVLVSDVSHAVAPKPPPEHSAQPPPQSPPGRPARKKLIEHLESHLSLEKPAAPCSLAPEVFEPHGLPSTDRLEERVRLGDACAALNLAGVLVRRVGRPEDYRRAFALLRSAQQVGVDLPEYLCVLFDLAGDAEGLAACLGDLRARWIEEHADELAESELVLEQYCAKALDASTSSEMRRCESDALVIRDVAESGKRAATMARLGEERGLSSVQATFAEYCDVETDRRAASFTGSGFMAAFCALTLEGAIHENHERVLRYLAELDQATDSTHTTAADVVRAERDARSREVLETLTIIHGVEGRKRYERLLTTSQLRFHAYERAVTTVAARRLDAPRALAIRSQLRRLRISALGSCFR